MFTLIKSHKKLVCFIIVLPLFLITLEVCTNIVFNIGVYFGTIARQVSEGVCCFR